MKRKNSCPSHSKKVRVKVLDDPADDMMDGVASQPPTTVKIENITFVSTLSGRFGQSTTKRTVLPNPAEHILWLPVDLDRMEIEDSDMPNAAPGEFTGLEEDSIQGSGAALHENVLKKTRTRPDLRAAVSELTHHNIVAIPC